MENKEGFCELCGRHKASYHLTREDWIKAEIDVCTFCMVEAMNPPRGETKWQSVHIRL